MMHNAKLAFLVSLALPAAACLGTYNPGTPGTPGPTAPSDPGNSIGTPPGSGSAPGGGSAPDGGASAPPPTGARSLFDANVAPTIMAKCAQPTCHGGTTTTPPPFAAGAASSLYLTVLNYSDILLGGFDKTQAQILLKIAPGNHHGATYAPTEANNIGAWLDGERAARAGSGASASPRDALLAKWSGCMTQSEFDAAGVATAWAQKQTDTSGTACQQCHSNAQGFLANADSTRMFNILTTAANPAGGWFLEYYFTVDTTTPTDLKVIINRDLLNRAATGTAQHELFNIDTDRGGANPSAYQRLTSFYQTTLQHLAAGTCAPPRLGTPTP